MKYFIHFIAYSFFVAWNILLTYITYSVWRYGFFTAHEPIRWIINTEMGLTISLTLFSIVAWIMLVTGKLGVVKRK